MEKRFALFLGLAFAILATNALVSSFFRPKPAVQVAQKAGKDAAVKAPAKAGEPAKAAPGKPGEKPPGDQPADAKPAGDGEPAAKPDAAKPGEVAPGDKPAINTPPAVPAQWVTLGSADPNSPYRMLVTLTNRGAAVERIELSSPRYRDLEDRSGYLGHLAWADAPNRGGCLVQAVGPGTPAHAAGLQSGDVIQSFDGKPVGSATALRALLIESKPNQTVELSVARSGAKQKISAVLGRRPLDVVRPEWQSKPVDVLTPGKHDPLSLLLTLNQIGDRVLDEADADLADVGMTTDTWEVLPGDDTQVAFRRTLAKDGLEVVKRYKLAKATTPVGSTERAYHLTLQIEISNIGDKNASVSYRLDGPTGLPTEGDWYANKIGRNWGAGGMRDVVMKFEGQNPAQVNCATIADGTAKGSGNTPLNYIAVDAQYFAAALIPNKKAATDRWFTEVKPIRVGEVPADKALKKLTDVSFRLLSDVTTLEPSGPPLKHEYVFFAGPKIPTLLEEYGSIDGTLASLVYYGWFGFVSQPMLSLLHGFYYLVGNYGLAIVMLTVLVRGAMFPLSRKQALSAQKMQELQPEIKKLTEKYKKAPEQRAKAQQELFRKHNYNPLGGCGLMFIQLPIFIGLYRSLSVDVELRQAPLLSENIRWCSNLAAPDMFWDWSNIVPHFIAHGTGFFGLGPYLNLLPLVTIALFIWQQKMFMPPPADEQAALQQKMMQYMMIFMGIMFFKVPSGLCIYFIASSIWGIAERKLLPKAKPVTADVRTALPAVVGGNGAAGKKKQTDPL